MARRNSTLTIKELLEAANAIVCEKGAAKLTLDAVVKRAGFSKGAIMHHFKTKNDLVARLTQDAIDHFNNEVDRARGEDRTPGSYARAYLHVTFEAAAEAARTGTLALLIELARDEGGREIFAKATLDWSDAIENDGLDKVYAQLIRMAGDGLLLYEISGYPLETNLRSSLTQMLFQMTKEKAWINPSSADRKIYAQIKLTY